MPSRFEAYQFGVFTRVLGTMGTPAHWTSVDGTLTWEGLVLFQNPTEQYRLAGMPSETGRYVVEYYFGQLDGLKEIVDRQENDDNEVISVDGIDYQVTSVERVHDGRTYRADVVPVRIDDTYNV
jgi:hypothetical protein